MATGYYVDGTPLEDLVAEKSDILEKMITSDNFFTLPEYNLSNEFGSTSQVEYNKGTWGVPINTIGYYKEGTSIPFIDVKSVPNPYLVENNDGTLVRHFPTKSIASPKRHGTAVKYISDEEIKQGITISHADGKLIVKKGNTTEDLINTLASPYVLIDIQGPGGVGGKAACVAEAGGVLNAIMYHALGSGAGGYSGNFVSLSAYLASDEKIQVSTVMPGGLDLNGYTLTSDLIDNRYLIAYGHPGANGSWKGSKDSLEASGGSNTQSPPSPYIVTLPIGQGSGIGSARSGTFFDNSGNNKNIFIINALPGNKGSNGKSLSDRWSNISGNVTLGSSTSDFTGTTTLTYIDDGANTSSTTITSPTQPNGVGQQAKLTDENGQINTDQALVGGGGGGPSLMAKGGTYPYKSTTETSTAYTPGIGAGGYGGSAWVQSRGGTDGHLQQGSSGGPGAMWIYYIPVVYNLSINIDKLTWMVPAHPGASFGSTVNTEVAYFNESVEATISPDIPQEYTLTARYSRTGSLKIGLKECINAKCDLDKIASGKDGAGDTYKLTISNVVGDVSITLTGNV